MKKILILVSLAFSVNAFAQFVPGITGSNYFLQVETEKLNPRESKAASLVAFPAFPPSSPSNFTRDLVPIYDSIYNSDWYTYTNAWSSSAYQKQTDFVYDGNNNLISNLFQQVGLNGWANYAQHTGTYDANNNRISWLIQKWFYTVWENDLLITYTYDANSNMLTQMREDWIGAWVNDDLYTYTHDANNNKTSELRQNWNASSWENNTRFTWTYDSNNNMASYMNETWNGSAWEGVWYATYTYDGNNNETGSLIQTWNSSAWVNDFQETYTNDVNNNPISDLVEQWIGNYWVNYSLFTYTYDANNNLTIWLWQNWDGSAWVNSNLTTFTYDANNFEKSFAYKIFDGTGTAVTSGDSTFNYFHTVQVGINDLTAQKGSIDVYPNPFSSHTTIQFNLQHASNVSLDVFDMNGRKVNTLLDRVQFSAGEHIVPFDALEISTGICFYRFTSDAGTESGKMVVVH